MRTLSYIVSIVGALCLAVSLVAAGFFACAFPATTRLFSTQFSAFEQSPYLPEKLTDLALATRNFTVDPYTEGQDTAEDTLAQNVVVAAISSSAQNSAKANRWQGIIETSISHEDLSSIDCKKLMQDLARKDTSYALDADAVQHLADANALITKTIPVLIACILGCLLCIIVLMSTKQRTALGAMLLWPAALLLIAFGIAGAWAAFDFTGFFSAFHAVFFPQGNWIFPYDSLLISMYPQAFWVAMGALWLVVTALAAIMCIVVGKRLKRSTGLHARS